MKEQQLAGSVMTVVFEAWQMEFDRSQRRPLVSTAVQCEPLVPEVGQTAGSATQTIHIDSVACQTGACAHGRRPRKPVNQRRFDQWYWLPLWLPVWPLWGPWCP